jgi:hypothetical protein
MTHAQEHPMIRMVLPVVILVAAAAAHAQVTVANSNPLEPEFLVDASSAGQLEPMRIYGARNGSFSGKFVLQADKPFAASAQAGELVCGETKSRIPADAIEVRYGLFADTSEPWHFFDRLTPQPPKETPVLTAQFLGRAWQNNTPAVGKATLPVWIIVNVPADAAAGLYKGQVSYTAAGRRGVVPVELTVAEWSLPEPGEFDTFMELIPSPETVAMQYEVELWSKRHFELLAESMKLLGQVGNRTMYLPLIAETNLGNEQTLVRWKAKGSDGDSYDYDFSTLEKYIDLHIEHAGKPQFVVLYVWDAFLPGGTGKGSRGEDVLGHEPAATREARLAAEGKGPPVTVVGADGKTTTTVLAPYGTAASKAQWKPMLEKLQAILAKRGLEKAICLGTVTDVQPTEDVVGFFSELLPDAPWMRRGHMRITDVSGVTLSLQMGPSYNRWAYDYEPGKRPMGWKGSDSRYPGLAVHFPRGQRDHVSRVVFRHMPEINIAGNQRGVGGWGLDFWPALRDRRGRVTGRLAARYPKSSWRNLNILTALTAPGPDGALPTARFQMLREGLQECQARIFIQKALSDPAGRARLGNELATRCEKLLDERIDVMTEKIGKGWGYGGTHWTTKRLEYDDYIASDWQKRSGQLFAAAAEVAEKLR